MQSNGILEQRYKLILGTNSNHTSTSIHLVDYHAQSGSDIKKIDRLKISKRKYTNEAYSSFCLTLLTLTACGQSDSKNVVNQYQLVQGSTMDDEFGPYNDSIQFMGISGNDTIFGSTKDDTMRLGIGNNTVSALYGDDEIHLQSWGNKLDAGPGFDTLFVQLTSLETILVDLDNNSMSQKTQSLNLNNRLQNFEKLDMTGSVANIDFLSTAGLKTLQLGAGNDRVSINQHLDFVDSGLGSDTIILGSSYSQKEVKINLEEGSISFQNSGNEDVRISGFENVESNVNVPVYLVGDANDNILVAGTGADNLYGAGGNDILVGGSNSDVFIFTEESVSAGMDRILDFQTGIGGDVIKINFSGNLTSTGLSFRKIDLSIETKKLLGNNSDILLLTGSTFENEIQVLEELNGAGGLFENSEQLNNTAQICLWENITENNITISIVKDVISDGNFADTILNVVELSGLNQLSFQELSMSNFDIA